MSCTERGATGREAERRERKVSKKTHRDERERRRERGQGQPPYMFTHYSHPYLSTSNTIFVPRSTAKGGIDAA